MANFITIARILLVFMVLCLLFFAKNSNILYFIAFVSTILAISMDGLDGYVARKYNLTSKLGAVLDIIGDRVVENVYWIAFTALGWVPVWIPIVIVTRGIVVDGIRSIALEQGMTAFGKTTMMKSSLGRFLVASNYSRGSYAAFKGIAFAALILINMPYWDPALNLAHTFFYYLAYISVYISVFFCVIRGLPVIMESKQLFDESDSSNINNETTNNNIAQEITSSH